jgi:hypothetical protein
MKITKTASGTQKVSISLNEWLQIGENAGWIKEAGCDKDKWKYINEFYAKKDKKKKTKKADVDLYPGAVDLTDLNERDISEIIEDTIREKSVISEQGGDSYEASGATGTTETYVGSDFSPFIVKTTTGTFHASNNNGVVLYNGGVDTDAFYNIRHLKSDGKFDYFSIESA